MRINKQRGREGPGQASPTHNSVLSGNLLLPECSVAILITLELHGPLVLRELENLIIKSEMLTL